MVSSRWRRLRGRDRRGEGKRPARAAEERAVSGGGPRVLVECRQPRNRGAEIVAGLGERFVVSERSGGESFDVLVLDAVFPHEAVVHLASTFDEIDADWEAHLHWPKALS